MQPLHAWQVEEIREGIRFDELNRPVRTKVVRFTVGTDGPFTLEMDAQGFSGEAMEKRLNEEAGHLLRLHPLEGQHLPGPRFP